MSALNFPASPVVGQTYTANSKTWRWNGTAWQSFNSAGPVSTGPILINLSEVTSDQTIAAGTNGVSAGPMVIDAGVTVTVTSGSTWVVV